LSSCDALHGGINAFDFKDYILTLLLVKYVAYRYKGDRFADIIVSDGASFEDMIASNGKSNIIFDDIEW